MTYLTYSSHSTYFIFKGYVLCGLFMMGIGVTLFVLHWEVNPSQGGMIFSNFLVLVGSFGFHAVQIRDILVGLNILCDLNLFRNIDR
jgi:hypothetical protein